MKPFCPPFTLKAGRFSKRGSTPLQAPRELVRDVEHGVVQVHGEEDVASAGVRFQQVPFASDFALFRAVPGGSRMTAAIKRLTHMGRPRIMTADN